MTATATPPAMAHSNQKPAPTVERVMVASDVLLSLFYFGVDAASARIASAASSVMSFPFSRLWRVIRETPRSLATAVGVPMDSRIALYSREVMALAEAKADVHELVDLAFLEPRIVRAVDEVSKVVGVFPLLVTLFRGGVDGGDKIRQFVDQGLECFAAGFDAGVFGGVHGGGWFGVDRYQWRRGERKIFLPSRQELSVKSFYASFLRLNADAHPPRTEDNSHE